MSRKTLTIHGTLDSRRSDVRARIVEAARQFAIAGHEQAGTELIGTTAAESLTSFGKESAEPRLAARRLLI